MVMALIKAYQVPSTAKRRLSMPLSGFFPVVDVVLCPKSGKRCRRAMRKGRRKYLGSISGEGMIAAHVHKEKPAIQKRLVSCALIRVEGGQHLALSA
jgi:hypothetical protein